MNDAAAPAGKADGKFEKVWRCKLTRTLILFYMRVDCDLWGYSKTYRRQIFDDSLVRGKLWFFENISYFLDGKEINNFIYSEHSASSCFVARPNLLRREHDFLMKVVLCRDAERMMRFFKPHLTKYVFASKDKLLALIGNFMFYSCKIYNGDSERAHFLKELGLWDDEIYISDSFKYIKGWHALLNKK